MTKESKASYLKEIKLRISQKMPKVIEEIETYEEKLKKSRLTENPKTAPQFNG
ncbi:MAG: hypothetical protein ABJO02_01120 [Reichenbachiella sp.]|uniref:hypothetical protein n=1 Tax=Reichenbachiella sp. TaxID=2184521 RepID=UPI0032971308